MTSPVSPQFDEVLQLLIEEQVAYVATTHISHRREKLNQCKRYISQLTSNINKPLLYAIIAQHKRNLENKLRSRRGIPNSRH